jgi:methylenetetrahydrofolate dehydrogenase (NADP+)/methenyltetrahydrofolate cyclohydrolase
MTAKLLEGRPVADAIWSEVDRARQALGRQPTLVVVHAGDDPAAAAYRRRIASTFARHNIDVRAVDTSHATIDRLVREASADRSVDGVLLQTPLPTGRSLADIAQLLDPRKDVEGIHPLNVGLLTQGRLVVAPSTAVAAIELARHHGAVIAGSHAVVVGRSGVVGKPLAQLLLARDATVTICHSKTRDLARITRTADLVFAAVGRARFVTGAMISDGAWVIDVGINLDGDRIVGDVDFDAVAEHAAAISPVPGGVGPVTTAVLARNLVSLAARILD